MLLFCSSSLQWLSSPWWGMHKPIHSLCHYLSGLFCYDSVPLSLSLTPFQPHFYPICLTYLPGRLLTQLLCTCCLYPGWTSPRNVKVLLHFLHVHKDDIFIEMPYFNICQISQIPIFFSIAYITSWLLLIYILLPISIPQEEFYSLV